MTFKKTARKILSCTLAALMLAGSAVTILPQVTDSASIEVQAATSFKYEEYHYLTLIN